VPGARIVVFTRSGADLRFLAACLRALEILYLDSTLHFDTPVSQPVAFHVLHMLSALASPWHLTSGTITIRFSQTACALVVSVPHFSCRYCVYLSWLSTSTELYCVYDVALLLL